LWDVCGGVLLSIHIRAAEEWRVAWVSDEAWFQNLPYTGSQHFDQICSFCSAHLPEIQPDFVGEGLHAVISLAADMASYVVLLVVVIAILRRLFFRPAHVERNFDAFLILSLVALLMIAYFGINGTAMLSGAMAGPYHPFSRLFRQDLP